MPPGIWPIGNLKIWVVGVVPSGRHQFPWCQRRAVFSCAPAMAIRKLSSVSVKAGAVSVPARCSATCSSESGSNWMALGCWRAFASGQNLHGADTIPADFGEQAERFGTC
jgi:hypothetical protein